MSESDPISRLQFAQQEIDRVFGAGCDHHALTRSHRPAGARSPAAYRPAATGLRRDIGLTNAKRHRASAALHRTRPGLHGYPMSIGTIKAITRKTTRMRGASTGARVV